MRISQKGLDFIKAHEGYRDAAYQDSVGVWTIGYGTTLNVKPGDKIDRATAEKFFARDLKVFEDSVKTNVKAPLTQNEYDALVSLVYNIGPGNFKKSPVLKAVNAKSGHNAILEAFKYHSYGKGGIFLAGLLKRRLQEFDLFKKKISPGLSS